MHETRPTKALCAMCYRLRGRSKNRAVEARLRGKLAHGACQRRGNASWQIARFVGSRIELQIRGKSLAAQRLLVQAEASFCLSEMKAS